MLHQEVQESNLFTKLADRTLFYDGDTVIPASMIDGFLARGSSTKQLCVDTITKEIAAFNAIVDPNEQIKVKTEVRTLDFNWNIPEPYLSLDVEQYVVKCLNTEIENNSKHQRKTMINRVIDELDLYEKLELKQILRTIIYIINTLRSYNVVWGIGRGSSVSSYVLYLIGVHDVDSIEYELDYTDFLRTPD